MQDCSLSIASVSPKESTPMSSSMKKIVVTKMQKGKDNHVNKLGDLAEGSTDCSQVINFTLDDERKQVGDHCNCVNYVQYVFAWKSDSSMMVMSRNYLTEEWKLFHSDNFIHRPSYVICGTNNFYFVGHGKVTVLDLKKKQSLWRKVFGYVPTNAGIVFNYTGVFLFGSATFSYSKAIFRFIPQDSRCQIVGEMTEPRIEPSVVSLDNIMYITGGYTTSGILCSGEKYDPVEGLGTTIQPMNFRRYGHGCTVFERKVYVCGGCIPEPSSRCAEVYDSVTNEWNIIAEMNRVRHRVSLFVRNMKIYAVDCDASSYTEQLEIYDLASKQWHLVGDFLENDVCSAVVYTNSASRL